MEVCQWYVVLQAYPSKIMVSFDLEVNSSSFSTFHHLLEITALCKNYDAIIILTPCQSVMKING